MNLNRFLRETREASQVNIWMLFGNMFLTLVVLAMGLRMAVFNERIVLVPASIPTKMTVGWDSASSDYYQSVGMTAAMLIGNITPSNTDFVIKTLSGLLEPSVYAPVRRRIEGMAKDPLFRNAAVSNSFSPSRALFEAETGKVFVVGDLTVRSAAGTPSKQVVTYEFGIVINNGVPVITSLDSYESEKPRTLAWKKENPGWQNQEEILK